METVKSMRVLFLGMGGEFSQIVLAALLEAELEICGVIAPAAGEQRYPDSGLEALVRPEKGVPLASPYPYLRPGLGRLAWDNGLPFLQMNRADHPETLAMLRGLNVDVACVACFSQILPMALLRVPKMGFLNVHPSLLPEYRGPEPLFWTLQQGQQETGVTVHYLEERPDRGPILAQAPVVLPDGISGRDAERLCATAGAKLLVACLQQLQRGNLFSRPQPAGGGYYRAPTNDDFRISLSWSARRAFNFMRGTLEWQRPYPVEGLEQTLVLAKAISYRAEGGLDKRVRRQGRQVWLQFSPGILQASTLF